MKTIYSFSSLIAVSFSLFSFIKINTGDPVINYENWDKTFVVHLSNGGGMRYESDNIYFRYDSCLNIHMENGKDLVNAFAMTDDLRKTVLSTLKKYNADKIRQGEHKGLIHDMATSSICFSSSAGKQCVSAGSSSSIHKDDEANFSGLWSSLKEIANKKTAKPAEKKKVKTKKGK